MRLFDTPLGIQVGSRFPHEQQIFLTGSVDTACIQQLDSIKKQLDVIAQKIQSGSQRDESNDLFQTTVPTKIALYYFNQKKEKKFPPQQQPDVSSILPVYRLFPASKNILVDSINELIKGNLTVAEQQAWFVTEFPNADFILRSATLTNDETLVLEFSDVPGFTNGWSARTLILSKLIEKTALQFPGVKSVVLTPESLFQP